jgi:NADPH:quinone reductase-like Zn-dependent oxidoreductase
MAVATRTKRSPARSSRALPVNLAKRIRQRYLQGIDAVVEIAGNTTMPDSLAMVTRGGHVNLVGFLGGGGPLTLEPIF